MRTKSTFFLKLISIIMMIGSFASICVTILGLLMGGLFVAGGAQVVGFLFIALVVLTCLYGILEFIAGCKGLSGRNLPSCKGLGITILILAILAVIFNCIGSQFSWEYLAGQILGGLLLPILYLVGVNGSIRKNAEK